MNRLTLFLLILTASYVIEAGWFRGLTKLITKAATKKAVAGVARDVAINSAISGTISAASGNRKRFVRDLKADPYLIYLSDTSSGLTFYKTDFDFKNVQKLLSIEKNDVDNLFLDSKENLLYWGYKNSSRVGCWNIKSKSNDAHVEELKKGNSAKMVGLGNGGTVYLYFPDSKELVIYIHESGNLVKTLSGLKGIEANMNCVDLDPRDLTQIYFDDCTGGRSFGRVLDINKDKIDESYIQELPKCFDQWRISPDAKLAYAASGKEIYLSPVEGTPYEKYYQADEDIVGFAVANNAIFFTTKTPGKIFKVNALESEGAKPPTKHEEFTVEGSVKAMVLYDLASF